MVDAHLRLKTINTEDIKNLIIGGQTGIDGIRFVLASSVNGEDLTNASFTWYLQYKNKYGQGESVVLTPTVEDNLVKLTWVPDSLATQVPGRLQIQLYATIVDGVGEAAVVTTRWVSEPALIYVQENLSPDPIIQTELSVFDYYLTMYSSFKEAAEAAAASALASKNAAATSEGNAANSAAAALASKNAAATSEGNAADSAAAVLAIYGSTEDVQAAVEAAATSEGNAADSAAAALVSKNAAATSEGNAANSAAAALASKNAAATSEGNASSSEAAALASKNAAATSEINAAGSAASALASAQAAEASKDNAAQSEINAALSAAASGDAAIVSQEAEALINAKLLGAFAADPATASAGAVYYNTVQKVIKVYDADSSTWKVAYADASQVGYDHASSGLESTDLQEAVDELNTKKITRPTSTDKAIPRFSGTSGDIQNSGVTIDDSGNITPAGIFLGGASVANLLDDYEEGTWTPTLEASTTNPTVSEYLNRTGVYTKIGNTVTVQCFIRATVIDAGSGYVKVSGLPFNAPTSFPGVAGGILSLVNGYDHRNSYPLNNTVLFVGSTYETTLSNRYLTFTATYEVS
ncbi:hypothetical protein [uncultured Sphaerochaeta sp.]|uniref:hypothetical protein n=1 Tax=uncultured Sphaerochaeta sp. TaxID=886478 RepID=UPI0029C9D751|nr:hypothetical protein [uncultured Sphaerochaeta sp.]